MVWKTTWTAEEDEILTRETKKGTNDKAISRIYMPHHPHTAIAQRRRTKCLPKRKGKGTARTVRVNITVTEALADRLRAVADKNYRSMSREAAELLGSLLLVGASTDDL